MTSKLKARPRPVSRLEVDRLRTRVEDLEDALELRAAEARGVTEDALPASAVRRLIAGAHPVRVWRERRGLTLSALAGAARVPVSYVSEIERGKKPGSVASLRKLATALGLDLDDLVR